MMHFDDILLQIGEFGRYQKRMYFLVCLMILTVACHQLALVFLAAEVNHWCRVPEMETENCTEWYMEGYIDEPVSVEDCEMLKMKMSIPPPKKKSKTKEVMFSQCDRYINLTESTMTNSYSANPLLLNNATNGVDNSTSKRPTIKCPDGWVFDTSQYKSTIVTDFDLVCSNGDLPNYSASIYFSGVLIGTFGFGCIADRIGRYPSLFICLFIQFTVGIGVAFAHNFWTFTWLRFIVATVNMSIFILAFVIGTEFVGPSWRGFTGMGVEFFFAFGYMILAILAYFIRDWRTLQIVITVPIALFFLLIPVLPESARWLIAQGKLDKAEKILRKVAMVNKRVPPENMLTSDEEKEMTERPPSYSPTTDKHKPTNTFIDLFKTPQLRKETVNLMFNMLVNNLVYYGLSISTSSLGVNDYLAFFISGAVEIPGYIFALLAMNRWGRRPIICISMLLGGSACILTTVLPIGVGRTVVAMVGKFGISSSFGIIYIYAAECFPTPVRTAGVGLCSMCGRLGGIIAPLILVLSKYWQPLPLLIFGCTAVFAGCIALFLPETLGKSLPETIEEGEQLGLQDPGINLPWRKRTVPEMS
ncbi:organic cation transporter protein-like [Amphiura filiformis]|uniref:organic cation transporter protein-like n=1 Tax=Amphiura filiformis TaxID=82378 RepID=UPI003B215D53